MHDNSLLTDKFVVIRDEQIIELLDNINIETTFLDANLHDDYSRNDLKNNNYIKNTNPFVWTILNNWWPIVIEKYLKPIFPSNEISVMDIALNQGHTPGNIFWHSDKIDSDGNPIYNDTDIICLYYLNSLDVGPLQIKNTNTGKITNIPALKGNMVLLNEIEPGMLHRIEPFDKEKYKRYVARAGFKIK